MRVDMPFVIEKRKRQQAIAVGPVERDMTCCAGFDGALVWEAIGVAPAARNEGQFGF